MLNHPNSIVSLSDAGAHLTFFNDAGFGLHLLGHWARDLGAMSLAEAARRLTSHPAGVLGLERAGCSRRASRPTCCSSIRERVGRGAKRRVHDLPGGAARLTTDALGVHGVWVNGVQVADANGLVAETPLAGTTAERIRVLSSGQARRHNRACARSRLARPSAWLAYR